MVSERTSKELGQMCETDEALYEEPDAFLHKLDQPMSMTAITGNTMYLHQVMAHPDSESSSKPW